MLRRFLPFLLLHALPADGSAGGGTPPPAGAGGEPQGGAPAGADPSSGDKFDSMFSDLDATPPAGAPPAGGGTPPAGTPPAGKPPEKAAPGKPAGGTPPAKPPAGQKPPAKPGEVEYEEVEGVQVPKFKSDKEFRGWGLNGYKKATQLEKELNEFRAKHSELEKQIPTTKAEREQLATRLADIEKKYNEKEQEIKYLNYERSGEYLEKYQTPYKNAIKSAYSDVKELTVNEPDMSQQPDADGKRPMKERAATPEDFDQVYGLPLGAATKLANKLFGESASIVLQHRTQIRNHAQAAINAVNEWKSKAGERETKEKADAVTRNDFVTRTWAEVNTNLAQKYPDMFAPDPNDPEGNKKLEEGFRMADAFFSDRSSTPLDQRIVFDAQIRNRIASVPRLRWQRDTLKAENEQLKKDIAELRASGPGAPGGAGAPAGGGESEGAMASFDSKM